MFLLVTSNPPWIGLTCQFCDREQFCLNVASKSDVDGLDKKGTEPINRENQQSREKLPLDQEFSDDSNGDKGLPLADDKQDEDGEINVLVGSGGDLIKIYSEANKKDALD